MPNSDDLPAPSILASDEVELLQHDGVRPPTQLGSCGRIGKFEIIKSIGQGGMGNVYAATEPVTGTTVAVKILKSEFLNDPRIAEIFLREARHMYQLAHPCILKVLEVSGADEGPFFVMPLVPGGSLAKRIGEIGVLDYGDTLTVSTQVAEGLVHAHGKGLIHRDLKPANVLLDDDGRALITDFGLVRSYLGDSMVNADRSAPEGTPAYMSPSVAAGQAEDTRCDIYAFGAMLYEMLAGHAPYQGRDAASVMRSVLSGPPPTITSVNPKAPKGLAAITGWCMARELRDRYASMDDVLNDLNRVATCNAPRGPHGTRIAGTWPGRLMLAAAALVLLLGASYGAWSLANRKPPLPPELPHEAHPPPTPVPPRGAPPPARPVRPASPTEIPARAMPTVPEAEESPRAFHQAITECRRMLAVNPSDAPVHEAMIKLLIQAGHLSPARTELDHWLRMEPDNEAALALKDILDAAEAESGEDLPPPRPGPEMRQGPPRGGRMRDNAPPAMRRPRGGRPGARFGQESE